MEVGQEAVAGRSILLAVARSSLIAEGLERFVLRDLAAKAGITLGNLQYYFPTRADLLEAVIRMEFDRDLDAFRRAVAAPGPTDPADDLRSVSNLLVENWCTGGSAVFAPLKLLAHHDERFAQVNADINRAFQLEVGHLVRRIDPDADADEIATRASLITSVLDGVAIQTEPSLCDAAACDELLDRASIVIGMIAVGATVDDGHDGPPSPPPVIRPR